MADNKKKDFATEMDRIARIADRFRTEDAEIPLSHLQGFVEIARSPGMTMKDLGDRLGISQSSTSRMVAALSEWHRLNKPGLELVIATEDPVERRRKILNLTPKGKRVAASLFEIMER